MVNTRVPKNNTFHCDYPITTFGVAFYHPSGLTVPVAVASNKNQFKTGLIVYNYFKVILRQLKPASSVWKSSPGTGKRLRPDQDWTAKDWKIERPEKTRTAKDR